MLKSILYLIGFNLGILSSGYALTPVDISFKSEYTNNLVQTLSVTWSKTRYKQMKISSNGNCSGGSWITANKSTKVTLASTDGKQSFSAQLKTSKGALSNCATTSITLDRISPTGSIQIEGVSYSPSTKANLTLSYLDNYAVSEMFVAESSSCTNPSWESAGQNKILTLSSGSGLKTISAQFKDQAGNVSVCYSQSVEVNPPVSSTDGKLTVEGKYIKDSSGQIVSLRGVNIPDPEHLNTKYWERPNIDAEWVANKAISEFNVNVIRIPVLPGNSSYPNEGWFSPTNGGQKYFDNHLKPLVDFITAQKVYAIIDLHYISDYSNLYDEVASFWSFIAPKFKDNPYVIYEIFNEPIYPDSWSTWKNTIAAPIVTLIRQQAPDNLIIVGGPYWSSHMSGAATNPIESNNIVYTAHVYSNQSASAWENNYGATLAKYPMFVTEWGFEQGGTEGGTKTGFGVPFLQWMEDRNLSWSAWSFDYLWGPKMFDSNWQLTTGEGGMGTFVRDALLAN